MASRLYGWSNPSISVENVALGLNGLLVVLNSITTPHYELWLNDHDRVRLDIVQDASGWMPVGPLIYL